MLLIPSIDILNGKCVRLYQGDYGQSTIYDDDPAVVALRFSDAGARRIHIVDLDAARGEGRHNRKTIICIRKAVSCMIEVGGGIRSENDVQELLNIGVERLIVGTTLAKDRERVQGWVEKFGTFFMAGIDAKAGEVRVSGWERAGGIRDSDLAIVARDIGMISIIYTNIGTDGTLKGPDMEGTARIAKVSGLPVVMSGGISGISDVENAEKLSKHGIVAAIAGKAVYEGLIDISMALKRFDLPNNLEMTW